MTRRRRAVLFGLLALLCAGIAAALANDYGTSVARSYGPLRPVLVARTELPAGQPIGPGDLDGALEIRRAPARFVPPGALAAAGEALGRAPAGVIPAGSYVLAQQLEVPRTAEREAGPRIGAGRRPVEITVSSAASVAAAGPVRVDVVVTTEPRGPGPGRTYVAAAGVRLLALARATPAGPGPIGGWAATLALTRAEALELIHAENFARQVRLLPLAA